MSTHTSLNKIAYNILSHPVNKTMTECFAHSYWNLLSDVIHEEIVLVTRKEVLWAVMPTPHGTFTVGTKVFSS